VEKARDPGDGENRNIDEIAAAAATTAATAAIAHPRRVYKWWKCVLATPVSLPPLPCHSLAPGCSSALSSCRFFSSRPFPSRFVLALRRKPRRRFRVPARVDIHAPHSPTRTNSRRRIENLGTIPSGASVQRSERDRR